MCFFAVFVINVLHAVDAEPGAASVEKECGVLRKKFRADGKIEVQFLAHNGRGDEEKTLFFSFSVYENGVIFTDVVFDIQGRNFPDAEAEAEEEFDDAHVADGQAALVIGEIVFKFIGGTGKERSDFIAGESFRQCVRDLKTAGRKAEETLAGCIKTA